MTRFARSLLLPAGCAALLGACAAEDARREDGRRAEVPRAPFAPPPTPEALAAGESFFREHCTKCHGTHAVGTDSGPALVHPYYRPAHHADQAFVLALRQGVSAHHWRFGDMPPQPQVPDSQVAPIVAYVRWLQQAAGIR